MKKLAKLAGTLPFAHLLGVKAATDPDETESNPTASAAPPTDPQDQLAAAQPAAAASTAAKAEDTDDDEDGNKKKDAKKAKAKGDGDDDEDDKEKAAASAERARCAKILAHGIKAGAVKQACAYAFDTSMSAEVAIATLDATADERRAAGTNLASRMQAVDAPVVTPEAKQAEPGSAAAVAQMVIAAGKKARGEA